MPLSQSMMLDKGPGGFYGSDSAIVIQKFIVPWSIAQYGLGYTKKLTLEVVKEMLIALCDDEGFLQGCPSAAVEAKKYAVSFADVAKKVKNAAGVYKEKYLHCAIICLTRCLPPQIGPSLSTVKQFGVP